jgi:hypothetical protein
MIATKKKLLCLLLTTRFYMVKLKLFTAIIYTFMYEASVFDNVYQFHPYVIFEAFDSIFN